MTGPAARRVTTCRPASLSGKKPSSKAPAGWPARGPLPPLKSLTRSSAKGTRSRSSSTSEVVCNQTNDVVRFSATFKSTGVITDPSA